MPSIIKRDHVRLETREPGAAEGPGPALPARSARPVCQKEVELLRVEGRVHALELRCSCGEKTLVELEYDRPVAAEE